MHQTVEAIYDNGVLRPLEQLSLRPKQRVLIRIEDTPSAVDDIEDKAFASASTSLFMKNLIFLEEDLPEDADPNIFPETLI